VEPAPSGPDAEFNRHPYELFCEEDAFAIQAL
jgi:hypothetical protein